MAKIRLGFWSNFCKWKNAQIKTFNDFGSNCCQIPPLLIK